MNWDWIPSGSVSRVTECIFSERLLSWKRHHIWRGEGKDFLKQVAFSRTIQDGWTRIGWTRIGWTRDDTADKGRIACKNVDNRESGVSEAYV